MPRAKTVVFAFIAVMMAYVLTHNERFPVSCTEAPTCDFPGAVRVPADGYFVLGDNRGASDDSRFWGPVPDKWVIGVAFFTYWPPDRIGFL